MRRLFILPLLLFILLSSWPVVGWGDFIPGFDFPDEKTATGSIEVYCTPFGSRLYLDGAFVGITPDSISDLDAGSYKVTIKETGYKNHNVSVDVNEGKTTRVKVSLEKTIYTTSTTSKNSQTETNKPFQSASFNKEESRGNVPVTCWFPSNWKSKAVQCMKIAKALSIESGAHIRPRIAKSASEIISAFNSSEPQLVYADASIQSVINSLGTPLAYNANAPNDVLIASKAASSSLKKKVQSAALHNSSAFGGNAKMMSSSDSRL